jgi:murein DD-endopeptidase MepM/ murein hydrolase activator NlpD
VSRLARLWGLLPALLAVGLLMLPVGALAQTRSSEDVERELGGARDRTSQLSDQLDRVRGDLTEAEEELAQIGARLEDARGRLRQAEGQVALGEEALAEAEDARDDAIAEHQKAERQLARTEAELEKQELILIDQIVEGFKYGTVGATRGAMVLEVLRRVDDPNGFAVGMKQLRTVVDEQDATVQRVFELRDERIELTDEAARARARASQAAAEAADTLQLLRQLREEAEDLAVEVETQEQAQAAAVEALQASEVETARMVERAASRQAELESELSERRAAEAAAERAEQERARQAQERARRGAAGGPHVSGGHCPVLDARTGRDFSNDWGYPRSGGRTHQGNDVFANRGRPVVAIADGVVTKLTARDRGLGGIAVTYRTGEGSHWYNAHLDTIAEGLAVGDRVEAGQEIGTVGNTGNARTTPPHLHLGRRHNGSWVNPYPTISALCR